MGRPVGFDRDHALAKAMEIFWLHGYEATSLQDLLAVMQLSKSSFYQSFSSKRALFLRAITLYRQQVTNELEVAFDCAASGKAFIELVFSEFADPLDVTARERGCFVVNSASEFAQRDAEVAELVKGGMEQFEQIFELAIRRAQEEGDIDAGRDPRALARYLISSRSGLTNMAKAGIGHDALRDVVRVIMMTLGW